MTMETKKNIYRELMGAWIAAAGDKNGYWEASSAVPFPAKSDNFRFRNPRPKF